MNKIICLVLLVCSFNVNAFVGELHEGINGNTLRILPKTIELDKGTLYAVVEIQTDTSIKLLYAFYITDCTKSHGILQRITIAEGIHIPPYTVFLDGSTLNEDIVRDMCIWAFKRTKY